ncbi:imidazole glycerol phosphate synthase subunit HisH [Thalassotalea insulae]|uniref:Imidazole glycerol phosphate synthase subunit HisH n=1 Tax=Thalassotalea insulae TaxID=2056778 RepID=A0ABQ6GM70_9GAMM|nr:imidazole glycerol phosphate synthase subunit HisH [Thalassotalea insulae]GLX77083.1 imidazole glycerol phosphate synthase subunit HisH [Thalassotalea insulae]
MTGIKQQKIVIVDTGCANLSSVKFAIERLGFQALITDDNDQIRDADKVILPGVGSAKHAMLNITSKQLTNTLQQLTQPVLGFCLGMQLMTRCSLEGLRVTDRDNTAIQCLNLIPTEVKPLNAQGLRLPHMGWNTLAIKQPHPILHGIKDGDYVYFVHSYGAPISEYTIASCQYGAEFSAAIAKDNFIGCQFHPERSGDIGSQIIKNFLTLSAKELQL